MRSNRKWNTTDQAVRARGEFYAWLASISSYDDLRDDDRHRLEEDLQKLIIPFAAEEVGVPRERQLWSVQDCARTWIYGLLKGEAVVVPADNLGNLLLKVKKGRVVERIAKPDPKEAWLTDMVRMMIRPGPFPFGLCAVCDTVFYRVRRQKYCSPNCTYKATERARKVARREYMRSYMADRRARERKSGGRSRRAAS